MSNQIFQIHADICKALAHAKRLEILHILGDDEISAGNIVKRMRISKANVSQHLSLMRRAGILNARRHGLNIYYSVSSPKIIKACSLMREVLLEHHRRKEKILNK